jgi:hypothetical protein
MGLRFTPYLNMLFIAPLLIVCLFSIALGVAMIGFTIFDLFERKK